MTPDDLKARIDLIEEAYEFFLAYAAQGLSGVASDSPKDSPESPKDSPASAEDSPDRQADLADRKVHLPDSQVRQYLRRCDQALTGLADGFRANMHDAAAHEDAIAVLERDAAAAQAFVRLALAQPAVSSQLIDNLNASIHVRALLTDLFVLGDLVK